MMDKAISAPTVRRFLAREYAARSPFWSWLVFERVGGALAYVFVQLRISPESVSLLAGAAGTAGAIALGAARDTGSVALACALLLCAYSLDCADGQLARATGRTSPQGAWLDVAMDSVVITFVSMSLLFGLLRDGGQSLADLVIVAVFAASRTASLFTSTTVRADDGGLRLRGISSVLRTAYVSAMDTPFVYVAICATRLETEWLRAVLITVAVLTLGQTVVSARHHFGTLSSPVFQGGRGRE
jgi:phosphatidylglycerophosphate synthase